MSATRGLLVLDTTVVLHLLRATAHGRFLLETEELGHRTDKPFISVVSVGEVLAFSLRNGWGEKKVRAMEDHLAELAPIDIRAPALIRKFAELKVWSEKDGKTLSHNDRWIAASAATLDATVITHDKDFAPLTRAGLKVTLYSPDQVLPTA